jgi:hypothetical protein
MYNIIMALYRRFLLKNMYVQIINNDRWKRIMKSIYLIESAFLMYSCRNKSKVVVIIIIITGKFTII